MQDTHVRQESSHDGTPTGSAFSTSMTLQLPLIQWKLHFSHCEHWGTQIQNQMPHKFLPIQLNRFSLLGTSKMAVWQRRSINFKVNCKTFSTAGLCCCKNSNSFERQQSSPVQTTFWQRGKTDHTLTRSAHTLQKHGFSSTRFLSLTRALHNYSWKSELSWNKCEP